MTRCGDIAIRNFPNATSVVGRWPVDRSSIYTYLFGVMLSLLR